MEDEAAFFVLTRDGQQCVLTIPLMAKLRELLQAKGVTLNAEEWATLQFPFKLTRPRLFSNGRFRIETGAAVGQECHSSIALTLGLDIEGADDSQ